MELLVVITIIAVLAAVSIPQVIGVIQRAQDAAIRMNMRVMLTEATRISILEGDLSRIHCNTGGHPDISAICETIRAHSPHPAQLRSSATTQTFWIRAPLHDGTFWRVDHRGFAGRDLAGYIARWDMDEGSDQVVGDATGTNPGTRGSLATSDLQDPTWAVGYLIFDGVDDRILIPAFGLGPTYTWEAWVHFNGPIGVGHWNNIINQLVNHDRGLWIRDDGLVHHCTPVNGVRRCCDTLGGVITQNRWYYIAATFNGVHMITYVDGREVVPGTCHFPGSGDLGLGASWSISVDGHPMHGRIDNVRIYNRALTAEEVRVSFLRGR